ncbi:MAG: phosphatase PAP2 family protein [Clostridia bacterium]|nr:phosphatase PAP2 family protein [Clostridia bacterium]
MFDALNSFELTILEGIRNAIGCSFLDGFFSAITKFADAGIGWIVISVLLLLFKRTRKTGIMVGLALVIGLLTVNCGIKPLVGRIRPYELSEAMKAALLVDPLSDGSFPSGHTLASFEAATVLMIRDKRYGIPALVLAFIIAFSRLYLCVHYPSDVLAGLILGVIYGILAVYIINKAYKFFNKKSA